MEGFGDDAAVAVGFDRVAPFGCVLEVGWNHVDEAPPRLEDRDLAVGVPLVVPGPVGAPEAGPDSDLG